MTFGIVRIKPHERNPKHSHSNCEELLYLLEGELEHWIGERRIRAVPGTLVRFPRNVEHHAENIGETDAVMVVCYSSPVRKTQVTTVFKRAGGGSAPASPSDEEA
jgi:quercetin dioxygenase-like cupin family protein